MELRICQQYGISHSHWLGGKPQWTDLDRDKARALFVLEAEECPQCHTLREDWFGEDGKPDREPVWTPDFRFCPGCEARTRHEKTMTEQQREAGGHVVLTPLSEYLARAET